jgi:hypothetical protein
VLVNIIRFRVPMKKNSTANIRISHVCFEMIAAVYKIDMNINVKNTVKGSIFKMAE